MKRKLTKKTLLLTLSVATISATPLVFLVSDNFVQNQNLIEKFSAVNAPQLGNTNNNNPGNSNKPEKTPAIPLTQSELNTNKKKIDDKIIEKFKFEIGQMIAVLNRKIDDLSSEDQNNIATLVDLFYLSKLKNFLTANADKIANNPRDFGLHTVFLWMHGQDNKFNMGTIDFNDQKFENVAWGNSSKTDYSVPTNNAPKEKTGEATNAVKDEEMDKLLSSYFDELAANITEIFLNSLDVPKYGKDFKLIVETVNGKSVISASEPLNNGAITNWDDYIKSKIGLRYTIFDLETNIKLNTKETINTPEEEQEEDVLESDGIEKEPIPEDLEITRVVDLEPLVTYEYTKLSASEFLKLFNETSDPVQRKKLTFFENPISARYEYTITALNESEDGLVADVQVVDRVDETKSKTYSAKINNINIQNNKEAFRTFLRYSSNSTTEQLIEEITKALGIPENYDFAQLLPAEKRKIFNLFYAITKIIFSKKFNQIKNSNIQKSLDQYSGSASQSLVDSVQEKNENLFLDYLKTTTINRQNLLRVYASIFNDRLRRLKKSLSENQSFLELLEKNNVNKDDLLETINYMDNRNVALKRKAESDWINNSNSFSTLINDSNKFSKVYNASNNLYEAVNKNEIKEEINEFNDVVESIKEPRQNFLISTLVFAFMAIIGFGALLFRKFKPSSISNRFLKTKTATIFITTFIVGSITTMIITILIMLFGGL